MSTPYVTSILASDRPYELSQFYSTAMNGEIQAGISNSHFRVVNTDGFTIQIYKPSKTLFSPLKGRAFALCLEAKPSSEPLVELAAWISSLEIKGAKLITSEKLEEFGAEAWLSDPEGNEFLLLVPFKNL